MRRKGSMKRFRCASYALLLGLLLLLAACASTAAQIEPQQTVTVSTSFQARLSPVPTVPPYRCGAWSSNNAPGTSSTISIYAKLTKVTKDLLTVGVSGAAAQAVVHFKNSDVPLDAQTSDDSGYVTFPFLCEGVNRVGYRPPWM
jgi:hypothetical protein